MIERIRMTKLENTRDLGGFAMADGRVIAGNRLLRSGELYEATSGDIRILLDHGLREVIDFRNEQERIERPDPYIPNVANIHLPILNEARHGISKEEQTQNEVEESLFSGELGNTHLAAKLMVDMYIQMVTSPFSLKQYACFMQHLLDRKEGAVLWHCAVGKDRVGLGTVFLLECLGADRAQIIEDYMLTGRYTRESIQKEVASFKQRENAGKFEAVMNCLMGVKREYIDAAYQTIEKRYGTVAAFLKEELGMDAPRIEALKENYLQTP